MSFPSILLPDVELVTVTYLRDRLSGVAVGTEWPPQLAERLPVVAVSLGGGGSRLKAVTADRTLDIDVLAATKSAARALAAQVSAEMIAAQNTVQPGAHIYGVDETSLIWLPYQASTETDPIPRYVLVMSLVIRPV